MQILFFNQENKISYEFVANCSNKSYTKSFQCLTSFTITVLQCGLTLPRKISQSYRKFRILLVESLLESGNLII